MMGTTGIIEVPCARSTCVCGRQSAMRNSLIDEPNARGALIWIVGEYAEKINDAGENLG